ncbi:MAG: glycosyl hydrolase family 18 protein [Ferruginibacter sp.]
MADKLILVTFFVLSALSSFAQKKEVSILAYYVGGQNPDSFAIEKLTHIIFSFGHLKGNQFSIDNARDSAMIQKLVSFKARNPHLKVMLSLGGWGGCATCSDVFATRKGRRQFARSVRSVNDYFHTDGLDLDWEYPVVPGYPGHKFSLEDKRNFTALVKQVRKKIGWNNELSFAAGGSKTFIDSAIDWKPVMEKMDRVNLMSYDLVGGFAVVTGHHTPLYSAGATGSAAYGVEQLIAKGVDKNKIVIGAAFYGRMFENVRDTLNGLYQEGKFLRGVPRRNFETELSRDSGFVSHWDSTAHAPYFYNASRNHFFTYDDERSVAEKTKYVIDQGLGGIMFWQLGEDLYRDGLLDAIYEVKKKNE